MVFRQSPGSYIRSPLTAHPDRRLTQSEFYPRAEKLQAAIRSTSRVASANANQPQYSTLYRDGE